MLLDILKGVLVGICASAPVGPTAVFIIQRALTKGHKAGFLTALGSCAADTTYAIVSVFALVLAQRFIEEYHTAISLIGGMILLFMGLKVALSDPVSPIEGKGTVQSAADTARALVIALTNPATVLFMLSLFALFGFGDDLSATGWGIIPVIAAVAAGTMIYWFLMTWAVSFFKRFISTKALVMFSRFTGVVIMVFGLVLIVRGLLDIIVEGATIF